MNYLSFQPAFDAFHTQFRFLRLRRVMSAEKPWHFDQLRIADFYLLFFFRLKEARLSPKHRSIKKLSTTYSRVRFENQPEDQLLFDRMRATQVAAIHTLIFLGYFDRASFFEREAVVETDATEPSKLFARVDEINEEEALIVSALQEVVNEYDLLGPDGLKARTRLLEYRYDSI